MSSNPNPPALGDSAAAVLQQHYSETAYFESHDNQVRTQRSQGALATWIAGKGWRAINHVDVPPPAPELFAHWQAHDDYTITISYGPETVIPPYVAPPPPPPLPQGVMALSGTGVPNRWGDIPATDRDTVAVGTRVEIPVGSGVEYQRIELASPFGTYRLYRPVGNIGKD